MQESGCWGDLCCCQFEWLLQHLDETAQHVWSLLTHLWLTILFSQGVNLPHIWAVLSYTDQADQEEKIVEKAKCSPSIQAKLLFFPAPVYNLCAYGLQRHPKKPWPLPASSLRGIKYVSELSESSINHDVRNAEFSHETQALRVRSRESLLYDSFIYNTYLGFHVYS